MAHTPTIASRATELTLPTGGRAVIVPTNVKDVVTIAGSIIGGASAFDSSLGIASSMAADLLDAGAGKLGKTAFRAALAARGAEVSFTARDTRLVFNASCFPEDAPFVIGRIADALFAPHFPAAEFASEKVRMRADIDEASANTRGRAERALTRLLYPSSHPDFSLSIAEEKTLAETATLAEVKSVARQYGTRHLALAIVGDVRMKQVRDAVEKAFGKAREGRARPSAAPVSASVHPAPKRDSILIPNKANADVVIGGTLGFNKYDDRYLPAAIATHMLGGSFAAHLIQTVRERDGLTYGASAQLRGLADGLDGYLQVWGTFAPQLLARGTEALLRETALFLKNGITAEKLADAREEVAGSYAVSLSTTSGLAGYLARFLADDRPLSWIDEYPNLMRAITLDEAQVAAAHLASLPLSIATAGSI